MPDSIPDATDGGNAPRRTLVERQWEAVGAALKARDMAAVVAFLHPLAVSDPHGVETFMAVVASMAESEGA